MKDAECIAFLQWALPKMSLRWQGFRKVRGQVCKRIQGRMRHLGFEDLDAYRSYLEETAGEWEILDALSYATVSRFFRDRDIFRSLADRWLPELAGAAQSSGRPVRVWSAGCCCGEEPYSLKLIWELGARPSLESAPDMEILATDVRGKLLEMAERGIYPHSSLKEVPESFRRRAFDRHGDGFRLRDEYKHGVRFFRQDIRREMPPGRFDLVLCRYLVFTYFDRELQRRVLERLMDHMQEGGILLIGPHEHLPGKMRGLEPLDPARTLYRKPGCTKRLAAVATRTSKMP